jgi:hypothetical protein
VTSYLQPSAYIERVTRWPMAILALCLALLIPNHLMAQKALVLGNTVIGGAASNEAQAAVAAGFTVTVADDATWESLTSSEFAAYQLLILGDPSCTTGTAPITAALSNTSTWGSVVNGNIVVIGTDPTFHYDAGIPGAGTLMKSAVKFAGAQTGKTGLYAALSCYYAFSPDKTVLPLLNGIVPDGSLTLIGLNGAGLCFNNSHIVASSPSLSGLSDPDLSNWSCSVHEAFDTYPPSFQVLAIAENFGSSYTATDGTVGSPYILSRGASVISNITLTPMASNDTVGGSQVLTATTLKGGSPQLGNKVTFHVIAGPDNGKTGTGTTNSAGQATFTLKNSPAAAGVDYINATFVDSASLTETSGNATVTWATATDTTPPACALSGTVNGPPKQILISTSDAGSGLKSIAIVSNTNDTVAIPNFTIGTTKNQTVTATKIDQADTATITLKVTDVAGNVTTCDPAEVTIKDDGRRGEQTVRGIKDSEHFVQLQNNGSGVDAVDILVNGRLFRTLVPTFNATTVDVAKAMEKGSRNSITIWARGAKGGSLNVLVHD